MIAVIFEVLLSAKQKQEYLDIATDLKQHLANIDGFVSIERFVSLHDENKLLSLSLWRDETAVKTWRNFEQHQKAQAKGRSYIFEDYRLRVAHIVRDYGKSDRPGS